MNVDLCLIERVLNKTIRCPKQTNQVSCQYSEYNFFFLQLLCNILENNKNTPDIVYIILNHFLTLNVNIGFCSVYILMFIKQN